MSTVPPILRSVTACFGREGAGAGVSGTLTGLTCRILGMVADNGIDARCRIGGRLSAWGVALGVGPFSSLLRVCRGVREAASACLLAGPEVVRDAVGLLMGVYKSAQDHVSARFHDQRDSLRMHT
jgi:hypothetical protein